MKFSRLYTKEMGSAYDNIKFELRTSEIRNPDGSVIFSCANLAVPSTWSQVATDILAQKYLRKAGVPEKTVPVYEEGVPNWLFRNVPAPDTFFGAELDARKVFHRLAGCWTYWGWKGGYFDSEEDAHNFYTELCYMLAMQMAAPNSPQWFNAGLHWAYGITGPSQGHWRVIEGTQATRTEDCYQNPQLHACYIQAVDDDLVNPGGIMDLWVREARLYKYGSGSGTNFSKIRGAKEALSGGGHSSGLMSFLKIGDRAAGAIKCLHEDTPILTRRGEVAIRDIRVGDEVATRSGWQAVLSHHDNGVRPTVVVTTSSGEKIRCTPEHKFLVCDLAGTYEEWKEVCNFTEGDLLTCALGLTRISGYVQAYVTPCEEAHVFDITVVGHEYLVHGIVTHNSGGTTRRAAKMVCLDIDHPDIEEFIGWKREEEEKVAALVTGAKQMQQHLEVVELACREGNFVPTQNDKLAQAIKVALGAGVPAQILSRLLQLLEQGVTAPISMVMDTNWEGEAYRTVSGQNSNNSVQVPDEFMTAMLNQDKWSLHRRTDGAVCAEVDASELWSKIAYNAWSCADPGVQYSTTINDWNTCPQSGRITASNPCSEYIFLDDTACNLASLNLVKFFDKSFAATEAVVCDVEALKHATRLWTVVLEISVFLAQYPSKSIAQMSHSFRPLGLGFTNLGALLMQLGLPYDSAEGRAVAAATTAIICGESYAVSAEMASELGAFDKFAENREDMLRVIRNHRRASRDAEPSEYEGLATKPVGISSSLCPYVLLKAAREAWDRALDQGATYGFRNAQVTACAPTGTIGLLLDCDTTGVEPDYALVKFKKLAGGGYFRIINGSVPRALQKLGYPPAVVQNIVHAVQGVGSLRLAPGINWYTLAQKGFSQSDIQRVEDALLSSFELGFAFNRWTLGPELCRKLGFEDTSWQSPQFDPLLAMGFTPEQVRVANNYCMGSMTIENAPGLRLEHLPIFDCANKCGSYGQRSISVDGHIKMMSAIQPFLSGAISKTINMPRTAKVSEVKEAYQMAWSGMVKAVAIYRDGSKLSQPLNTISEFGDLSSLTNSEDKAPALSVAERMTQRYISQRHRLPDRRSGYTQKGSVGNNKIYIRTGEYADGSLGEIFIDMHREGAAFRSVLNCFAIAVSLGLQHGVPLEEYVDAFVFTKFEPNGAVSGHDAIKMATSVIDYIFRDLGLTYLGRMDLVQVPPDVETMSREDMEDSFQVTCLPGVDGRRQKPSVKSSEVKVLGVVTQEASNVRMARLQGYEGDACPECANFTMVRNGTCLKCNTCGATSGCS